MTLWGKIRSTNWCISCVLHQSVVYSSDFSTNGFDKLENLQPVSCKILNSCTQLCKVCKIQHIWYKRISHLLDFIWDYLIFSDYWFLAFHNTSLAPIIVLFKVQWNQCRSHIDSHFFISALNRKFYFHIISISQIHLHKCRKSLNVYLELIWVYFCNIVILSLKQRKSKVKAAVNAIILVSLPLRNETKVLNMEMCLAFKSCILNIACSWVLLIWIPNILLKSVFIERSNI